MKYNLLGVKYEGITCHQFYSPVAIKGLRMLDQDQINYARIEKAIRYIKTHFKEQPSLEDIAAEIHLSPFHFQRLFTHWAGVSPKKFMRYLSLEYAKSRIWFNFSQYNSQPAGRHTSGCDHPRRYRPDRLAASTCYRVNILPARRHRCGCNSDPSHLR